VGKSSLLNTLEPDLELRTGQVTTAIAGQGKGTHTTTAARLIKLSLPDTHLVDSPGIRAFGLGQLGPSEIAAGFPEMRRWEPDCRVRGYLHNGEPDCAVASGMSRSAFGQHRLDSYRRLLAVHSQR
jgi:ribosome biogenesis GTPase